MPKLLKCWHCGVVDTPREGLVEYNGKRYHSECEKEYKKKEEFKQRDLQELDDLYNFIKEIHNVDVVPPWVFTWIQDIRNGTIRRGKTVVAKKKQGVRYSVIQEAYRISKPDIEYAQRNLEFKTKHSEFAYVMKIVVDKLLEAYEKQQRRKAMKNKEQRIEKQAQVEQTVEVEHKKKKDDMDISRFLR